MLIVLNSLFSPLVPNYWANNGDVQGAVTQSRTVVRVRCTAAAPFVVDLRDRVDENLTKSEKQVGAVLLYMWCINVAVLYCILYSALAANAAVAQCWSDVC